MKFFSTIAIIGMCSAIQRDDFDKPIVLKDKLDQDVNIKTNELGCSDINNSCMGINSSGTRCAYTALKECR